MSSTRTPIPPLGWCRACPNSPPISAG
jgi:hypothetical protein